MLTGLSGNNHSFCIHHINNLASTFHFLFCIQRQGMFVFPLGQSSFAAGLVHFTSPAVRAPRTGPHCTPIYEILAIFTNKKQPARCIFFSEKPAKLMPVLFLVLCCIYCHPPASCTCILNRRLPTHREYTPLYFLRKAYYCCCTSHNIITINCQSFKKRSSRSAFFYGAVRTVFTVFIF